MRTTGIDELTLSPITIEPYRLKVHPSSMKSEGDAIRNQDVFRGRRYGFTKAWQQQELGQS